MTGFGRAEVPCPANGKAVVEIQTLNHRFLEVECRLPEGFQGREEAIRSMVGQAIRRGRVKVSVTLKGRERSAPVVFQAAVARAYTSRLRALQKQLGLSGSVTLEMILGLPQVVTTSDREIPSKRLWVSMKEAVAQALEKVVRMRCQEGARLEKVLDRLVKGLAGLFTRIRGRVPKTQRALEKRLANRIRAIASTAPRSTIAAEAASIVQATDVSEELARIESHLSAVRHAVKGLVESPGRTIDFLAQELQREVNTLGAKLREGAIVRWVVAMKGQVEKMREQAANVE